MKCCNDIMDHLNMDGGIWGGTVLVSPLQPVYINIYDTLINDHEIQLTSKHIMYYNKFYISTENYIFINNMISPLEGSNPLALSSACSWQRAQGSQQKWTQQSLQGVSGNPNFLRIFSLYRHEYTQWHSININNPYTTPWAMHATYIINSIIVHIYY